MHVLGWTVDTHQQARILRTSDYTLCIRPLPIYLLPQPGPPRRARRPTPQLPAEAAVIGDSEIVEAEESFARTGREEEGTTEGAGRRAATTVTDIDVGVGFTDDHCGEGQDDPGAFAFHVAESDVPRSPCTRSVLSAAQIPNP